MLFFLDLCGKQMPSEIKYEKMEEAIERLHALEEKFTVADWEYQFLYAGNSPYRTECRQKIEALKQAEEKQ